MDVTEQRGRYNTLGYSSFAAMTHNMEYELLQMFQLGSLALACPTKIMLDK